MKDGRLVVLLTGANGFVGRNVAPVLMANGMSVRQATRKLQPDASTVIIDDIGPQTNWAEALIGVDAVVHLAARAGVRQSVETPHIYVETNVAGTLNMLEVCRQHGVRKFMLASTSSLYGDTTQ